MMRTMIAMVVASCAHLAHSENVARGLAHHAFVTSPLSLLGRSACNAHSQKLNRVPTLPRVGGVGLAMQQMGRKQVTTCVCVFVCVCVCVLCVRVYQR